MRVTFIIMLMLVISAVSGIASAFFDLAVLKMVALTFILVPVFGMIVGLVVLILVLTWRIGWR